MAHDHLQVTPAIILLVAAAVGRDAPDNIEDDGHQGHQEEELQKATEEWEGHDEGGHEAVAKGHTPAIADHRWGDNRSRDDDVVGHLSRSAVSEQTADSFQLSFLRSSTQNSDISEQDTQGHYNSTVRHSLTI